MTAGSSDMPDCVTIGITAYNVEDSIRRAVWCALQQTWRPIEIVVVDDCSTDGTDELLQELASAHPEIRAFRHSANQGVAAARNRIIAEARGEFIVFFDDDDESAPDRVSLQIERICDYEKAFAKGAPVICHTARRQIDNTGGTRIERTMGQREGRLAPNGPAVARRILAGEPLEDGYGAIATCSQMARTETYRALGGFDPAFRRSEDTEFCVRLALAGGHFVGISKPLVTQTLTATPEKSLEDEKRYRLALIDKHREVFDDERHYRFSREWAETKYVWLGGDRLSFARRLVRSGLGHPLLTWQRIRLALPTLEGNRAFARFHRNRQGS